MDSLILHFQGPPYTFLNKETCCHLLLIQNLPKFGGNYLGTAKVASAELLLTSLFVESESLELVEAHDEGHGDGLIVLTSDGELASGRRLKSELNTIYNEDYSLICKTRSKIFKT